MPKTKPRYSKGVGWWSSPATFTEKEKALIKSVCDKPDFMSAVADIVGDYRAEIDSPDKLSTPAEDLATLKDLRDSVYGLKRKLSMLGGGRVEAHLYKVSNEIDNTIANLNKIYIEIILAIKKHPNPKAGRTIDYAKRHAAERFKHLFDFYGIKWNISMYGNKDGDLKNSPAINILSTFLYISPEGAAVYVKLCEK